MYTKIAALSLLAIITAGAVKSEPVVFDSHADYLHSISHIDVPAVFTAAGLGADDYVGYIAAVQNIEAAQHGLPHDESMIAVDVEIVADIEALIAGVLQ